VQQFKTENQRDHDLLSELRENDALIERLRKLSGRSDPEAIDQYWRELVDSRAAVAELEQSGLSLKEIRNRITDIKTLLANGDGGLIAAVPIGHQWPPIISLSEAGGYFFKSGSAELSSAFRDTLIKKIPSEIFEYIKKYDVDVIEVVGHTDEQPIGQRQSNLDQELLSVLRNTTSVASLVPADNAGLGLARAVSVVSVLRQSALLSSYKLIPLSGAQLVNTDETLAVLGIPANVPERRRIEIRLRKSVPRETTASITQQRAIAPPRPRPIMKRPPLLLSPKAHQAQLSRTPN
jgi:flagellar motor protein MotB